MINQSKKKSKQKIQISLGWVTLTCLTTTRYKFTRQETVERQPYKKALFWKKSQPPQLHSQVHRLTPYPRKNSLHHYWCDDPSATQQKLLVKNATFSPKKIVVIVHTLFGENGFVWSWWDTVAGFWKSGELAGVEKKEAEKWSLKKRVRNQLGMNHHQTN